MDSFKVLQLLAHKIQHPKVLDFLSRYRMTECQVDGEWHYYQNPDNTLQLHFVCSTAKNQATGSEKIKPVSINSGARNNLKRR